MRILLVEDDAAIAASVSDGLAAAGHEVEHVGTAAAVAEHPLDVELILLDLGLPDGDGLDVCRAVRERSAVPIIVLTARDTELDRVLGLELGADDYVSKPFSMRELIARIKAVTRRYVGGGDAPAPDGRDEDGTEREDREVTSIGPLAVDRRTRRVTLDGDEIVLTQKEFDVLATLAEDPGAVWTRTDLIERVWDSNWFGPTKMLDAHVAAVRKKLGDHGWIEAVRGVGFRLARPDGAS